jgi:nucleoside-diphosphate-sugar epimerase
MKRVLMTGGCGFVGRHFVKRLLDAEWEVMCVDDLSAGIAPYEWNLGVKFSPGQFDWLRADARTYFSARQNEQFDLVIHCAAIVGGRLKIEGDPLAVATDLAIDSDLFQWAVKAKPKKIVYFSSSAVYPIEFQRNDKCKIDLYESLTNFDASRIGRPDMTYGWAKLTGEYLAKQAVEKYGLDVVIYRPFSGYGEDQSRDYPFTSIIERVVRGDDPITIWGSGDQVRDFIHIDDIVECVLQTMDVLEPGEVLNLGSGDPTSFRDLVHKAENVIRPVYDKLRATECDTSKPEGVFYRVADTYKMNQFYTPKVSLEEGIKRVAEHLKCRR